MDISFTLLLCNPLPGIVETLVNAFASLEDRPKILLVDKTDSVSSLTRSHPDFFYSIALDTSNKDSWLQFLNSEDYSRNPVFADVQYIFILAKNSLRPDSETQKTLGILSFLKNEKKLFTNDPVIFCEMVDDLEYDSLKEKAQGVFSKESLLAMTMAFLSVLHYKKLDLHSYLKMFEKQKLFLPDRKHFSLQREEKRGSQIFLIVLSLILFLSMLVYVFAFQGKF